MATVEGLLDALEQLVWLFCETAREKPLQLFTYVILPLAGLGIFCVGDFFLLPFL